MPHSLLIDSDVLIDHLRKEKSALVFLSAEIEQGAFLFVSVISRIEILAGIRKGEEGAVADLFELLTSIPVDESISDRAGEYLRRYGKSHGLNIGDAIIAATAGEMTCKLVTRNVKHYPMNDIETVEPYAEVLVPVLAHLAYEPAGAGGPTNDASVVRDKHLGEKKQRVKASVMRKKSVSIIIDLLSLPPQAARLFLPTSRESR